VRWHYSPVPSDVADLRGRVRAALTGWGVVGRLAEDVVLVVSELASNAIEHARTSLVVSLDDGRVRVRVRVRDYSHDRPVLRSVEEDPRRGWGLRMIAQVASWGWKPHSDGKTVWAEIERPPRGLRAVRP
jgi:anti-sigma regulatory factor (Ser/Thr protein kinase)